MTKTFENLCVGCACMSMAVALGSCSEQVNNEVITEEISWRIPENQGLLRVQTRSETPLQQGKVYVFDSEGSCVRLLTTDEGGQLASTTLAAGSYTVCAIGGEDLDAYTLPEQERAAASSVIALAEGQTMGDLFMTSTDVTLTAGDASNLALELDRQVMQLKEVTIKQVPADVTKVEVSIAPLHQGIMLNGTLTEEHTTLQLELTQNSDNSTWTNEANQPYCFPSDGEPTITVSFTLSSGVKRYSYQASEAFEANHQVVLEGTYSEEQDAVLSCTFTAKAWEAEKNIPFEFNEENLVEGDSSENPEEPGIPVAGSTYLGYYVISVNSANHTAVLLSKTQVDGITSALSMEEKASQIEKPDGVNSGEWRLPTVEECRTILEDNNVEGIFYNSEKHYYCIDGDKLKRLYAIKASSGVITVYGPEPQNSSSNYVGVHYYRPVIDITY